jgi:hypothetical protein
MAKAAKILGRMRNNPKGWGIKDLKVVADRFHIEYRQPGTSHVTFRHPSGVKLTVPARKPIKTDIREKVPYADRRGDP